MKRYRSESLLFVGMLLAMVSLGSASLAEEGTESTGPELLGAIGTAVEEAIRAGNIPGAVVLIGHAGEVVFRQPFGYRSLVPERIPMTVDTVFDLASLTKVVATTTAVMQLLEKGRLRIDDPVSKFWPEFKAGGKETVTIRHLLTHYSGLRELGSNQKWSGYDAALKIIGAAKPVLPPGTRFQYCDVNFIVLGELVRRISGRTLDVYSEEFIFKPLGMKDTRFRPDPALIDRIAPTQYQQGNSGKILCGEVHDSICYNMGGVSGHAGLFSTADDLSIFAQALLDGGKQNGTRILGPLAIEKMTTPQSPPGKQALRGLGWDIDSPFASNRGELFPVGSYGHTGFTGTSIWIDPVSKTYVIILTNRVHPDGKGDAVQLRSQIATIVAAELGQASPPRSRGTGSEAARPDPVYPIESLRNGKVAAGIDVLESERFAPLAGLRVGLITNHSALNASGKKTSELIRSAPGVKLVSIFSPEHGLTGEHEGKVASFLNPRGGPPVYSLYGDVLRPTDKMLAGLDALVFDVQDAGVRFYTYITTMAYAMEAAAKKRIAFYVLDRPNPLTAAVVQGPVMDREFKSFTGYFSLPVRHGMTVGELAQLFNEENKIGAKLHVIKMRGYNRSDWYDETGLIWVNPSPNLRTLTESILYPGVAMVEASNISVGRGTSTPFELLGAPWINEIELASYLNGRRIQGVRFMPASFIPESDRFKKQICHGVQILLMDRQALDSGMLGIEIAAALWRLYPRDFQIDKNISLIGSRRILQALKEGQDPNSIALMWHAELEEFLDLRSKYLFY